MIRVNYVGICNTDLEILKGYMGFTGVLGHEFVGTVVKSTVAGFEGKRVVGEINLACGKCSFCMQGLGRHCPYRKVLGILGKDGVMEEYITLPVNNLHVVPTELTDFKAVFVEPFAAACEILEQLQILPEYEVAVLGDGKLAQLIARVLSLQTDKLLVVGKHPHKLALLKEIGIKTKELKDLSEPEHSFHVVVEATGSWDGWDLAMKMVRPRGYVVLKSTYVGTHSFNPANIVINEINLIGSRCGPFPLALQLLRKGAVDPTDLITEIFSFEQWKEAFLLAGKSESLKVLLKF